MKIPNARRAKLHRVYRVDEAAILFGVSRSTVRAWINAGLPAVAGRPALLEGGELRRFLERRRAAGKRPCPPGTLYCFKCHAARAPLLHCVAFQAREHGAGNLRAICATCGTRMFQRVRQERLPAKMPGIAVLIVKALGHITECPLPSSKHA